MNEQACDFCGGSGSPGACLCHPFPEFRGSRMASRRLLGARRERLCRTALGLVRPALSLLGALRLRLPVRLLSLLAGALLARLVLGSRAAKAPTRLQRATPERAWPFGFAARLFLAECQMNG